MLGEAGQGRRRRYRFDLRDLKIAGRERAEHDRRVREAPEGVWFWIRWVRVIVRQAATSCN
jgi:hypothetical protein